MTSPIPGFASHFGLKNFPFGIASTSDTEPSIVSRYEDTVIFLNQLGDLFKDIPDLPAGIFNNPTLNQFATLPKTVHTAVRARLREAVDSFPNGTTHPISACTMHLPMTIGDFTDFSCSHHHVQHVSAAMTGKSSTPPAFFNMPIGYAGRCSCLEVSGTPVERPCGQHWSGAPFTSDVVFGPTQKFDYELELGCLIGKPVPRNTRIRAADAEEYIFGYVLVNDWSARDIQALEMIPLGPLNSKNSATTVSPWVVTTDALAAFKTASPPRNVPEEAYLKTSGQDAIRIAMQVDVSTAEKSETLCRSDAAWMYWSLAQCVAQQAVGGCGLRTGDLFGSGTVSGEGDTEHGCWMEMMRPGATPPRGFLRNGETVTLSGFCGEGVGFGECVARVLPARE